MKNSKGVYVTNRDLKAYNRNYELYSSRIVRGEKDSSENYEVSKNFSCQYDSKRDNVVCTCKRTTRKNLKYYMSPRQIYTTQERYPGWKSFTEIGVGCIKTLPKRRTKRIYLPETDDRGVGSSDYSLLFEHKKRHLETSYYDQKITSSKCVGGLVETNNPSLISKKLSPIVQTTSCANSPIDLTVAPKQLVKSTDTYKVNKNIVAQIEYTLKRDSKTNQTAKEEIENTQKQTYEGKGTKAQAVQQTKVKSVETCTERVEKDFSSDSLVQHVHNLENPSFDKQIRSSIDPMENKLEREYRKMFTTKENGLLTKQSVDKPVSDLKSASILRRRFEALRKGMSKKEDSKKDAVIDKHSSQKSTHSRKDVSIASDPPSLEPKSYSNTKIYSPYTSFTHPYKYVHSPVVSKKKCSGKNQDMSSNWSTDVFDSDCQGVKGMFKLWGKKFNLEEDTYKKFSPKTSIYTTRKSDRKLEKVMPERTVDEKKYGKRFFFFKKRSKDKTKQVFKAKKGVTAGRCEVEDGFTIKIGDKECPTKEIEPEHNKTDSNFDNFDNNLRKSWLRTFLTNKVDSKTSLKIRWNNNMYATSSSTAFELLDCVYKNTGLIIRSKSDVTTGESSNYYRCNKHEVKFMQKNIEAWMIPKTIYPQYQSINMSRNERKVINRNIQLTYSDRKWYIDNSHRGNKIELVLHSKNFIKAEKNKSSEYILIDIPKGYFTESLTLNNDRSSDEEVYKITDYESPTSNSNACQRNKNNLDTGDHVSDNVKDVMNAKSEIIKSITETHPLYRDVTVQGSQVCIPKHCDVIGVGIITQRDIRDIKKTILKIHDDETDSESAHKLLPPKKCEFAESYLQDYYRHWVPLGIDLFSWYVSDSQLRCSSDNMSRTSLNNQGDGSKSCPNIYDDYQTSNIVSSCSHCFAFDDGKRPEKSKKEKTGFLDKFLKKTHVNTPDGIRVSPKDSLEVLKKRKLYACGNKSNWNSCAEPCSVTEDKCAQPSGKECYKYPCKPKKSSKKHVSIPDCETMECKQQSCVKVITSGYETCKKASACQSLPPPCKSSGTSNIPSPWLSPPLTPPQYTSPPYVSPRKSSSPKSPTSMPSPCSIPPCTSPPCIHTSCCPPPCKPTPCVRTPYKPPPCKTLPYKPPPCMSPPSKPSPCRPLPGKSPSCLSLPYTPPHCKDNSCKTPPMVCKKSSPLHCVSQGTSPLNTLTYQSPPISPPDTPTYEKSVQSLESVEHNILTSSCSPCTRRPQSPPKTPCTCCSQESACCSLSSFQKSGLKLQMAPVPNPIQKGHKNCPSLQKRKDKECSLNCANRRKQNQIMHPPPAPPPTLISPQKPPDTLADTFLKQFASKKRSCPEHCPSGNSSLIPNTIRLNSKENITINLKKQTPSTQEIREAVNIKVQDEDGRTLYERVDYRKYSDKNEMGTGPDNTVIKNLYRDSHIHRVSTSTCVNEVFVDSKNSVNSRSCSSLSNLLEINFTLKFKHGDNCENAKEEQATDTRLDSLKEVYLVQDNKNKSIENTNIDKNDVNISIFIKNYKQNDGTKTKRVNVPCTILQQTDEFSRKISRKFHTVATGYSEYNVDNQAFSVHTTATDFHNSKKNIKSNTNRSKHSTSGEDSLKPDEFILTEPSQSSAEHTLTDNTMSSIKNDIDYEIKTDVSEKCSKDSFKNITDSNTDKSETGVSFTDEEKCIEINSNKQQILKEIKKLRSRKEKKDVLKKIFEKASSVKTKNKAAVKTIREMLHAILTSDSSGQEDHSNTGNALINELTYESLKPNYFKDTDSMNNFYNLDNTISEEKVQMDDDENEEPVFPTKQNSSQCVYVDKNTVEKPPTCMCSTLAARLNLKTLETSPCCCRARDKKDEETHCDLIKEISKSHVRNNCASICVQTHDYKNNLKHTVIATNVSTIVKIKSNERKNDHRENHIAKIAPRSIQACMVQKLNKRTLVVSADDNDKVVVLNKTAKKISVDKSKQCESDGLADVLQSNETKKAVLGIYAEKIQSSEGTHIVAKLPKYAISRESKIYEVIEVSKEKVYKKDTVTMKIVG